MGSMSLTTPRTRRIILWDVKFTKTPRLIIKPEATIDAVRHYRLIVTENNSPVKGVPIRSNLGEESTTMGQTDENGEATITIHYCELTNTTVPDTYTVWVKETPVELTIFTDSPIRINALQRTPPYVLMATLITILGAIAAIIIFILIKIGVLK
jgi:hypothetical protein